MEILLTPLFRRQFKKLPESLQEEAFEKIELFSNPEEHQRLRVHKLSGRMKDRWSFSVNYEYRIVFRWEKRSETAVMLAIGTHKIYE